MCTDKCVKMVPQWLSLIQPPPQKMSMVRSQRKIQPPPPPSDLPQETPNTSLICKVSKDILFQSLNLNTMMSFPLKKSHTYIPEIILHSCSFIISFIECPHSVAYCFIISCIMLYFHLEYLYDSSSLAVIWRAHSIILTCTVV